MFDYQERHVPIRLENDYNFIRVACKPNLDECEKLKCTRDFASYDQ